MLNLDIATTALLMVDLQKGIVPNKLAPHTGEQVVTNAVRLADRFRAKGGLVVWIRVDFGPNNVIMPNPELDKPIHSQRPADWTELVPELKVQPNEIVVTKHQWGAFYNTDLDVQLRRRGIRTLVLGGIATNMGVESTARCAFERCYEQVFVEDAMSSFSAEWHDFPIKNIFIRMGRVRSTDEVLAALG